MGRVCEGQVKVISRIVGITQNEKSLDRYFLIATEVLNLQREFKGKKSSALAIMRKEHTMNSQKESSVISQKMQPNTVQYFVSMKTHLNLFMRIRYTTC